MRRRNRLISDIYDDIYAPAAVHERLAKHARRPSGKEKHARKVDREISTTLKGLDRKRRAEALARDKELHRLQQARWAANNPDKIAAYQEKWRAKQDAELLRQYDRDAYAANPEPKKARAAAYYAKNREAINARRRAK